MNNSREKYNDAFVRGSFDVIPQFNGKIIEIKAITPDMEKKIVGPNNESNTTRKFDFKEVAKNNKEKLQELKNLLLASKKHDIKNEKKLKLTIS
jgi:hypothetical protein